VSALPVLEIRGLGKQFPLPGTRGCAWILKDLDLSAFDGEFLTIVGPSGAGKTTLLNLIAQVDMATRGEIRFRSEVAPLGNPRALKPGLSCRIGYVMQDDHLLPWRTTIDNVLLPLKLQGRLTASSRDEARLLLATAGLEGFEHHYPHELSGGMRKRVSLIRTLVYDPPVILMDEPFGSLDPETRAVLQEDLLRLWHLRRKTIVFVTHDIVEAIALGDRVLVLTRPPTQVRSEHLVGIPRPRQVRGVALWPGFVELCDAVRSEVW
jgi:NitT/TauT family transport system ATP-binding protein